ncbi:hypothetical protein [Amycolatopsis sp. NPDC051903]|uniref:hypothetical protein n=1 Tax=Amycolatopsis sp. NPDC051903 TaxID=3363936 RepID=UPI0037A274D2
MPLGWAPRTARHEVQITGRPKFTETSPLPGSSRWRSGADDDRLVDQSTVDGSVDFAELWKPSR